MVWLGMGLVVCSGTACDGGQPTGAEVIREALEHTPALDAFSFTTRGTLNQAAELQGSRPGGDDEAPFRETFALTEAGTLIYEMELDRIDGSREWVREIHEDDAKTLYLLDDSVIIRLRNHPEVGGLSRLRRRVPALLLREIATYPDSALAVTFDADTAHVSWTSPEGTPMVLTVGPDAVLHRVEYPVEVPALGHTTVSWSFSDYRSGPAGTLPHRYTARVGPETFVDMQVLAVSDDASDIETLAAAPAGFHGPIEVDGSAGSSAAAEVEELGPGLYRIRNLRSGFHPLVVEFDDFVAVVDAPTGYPLMLEIPPGDVAPGPGVGWLSEIMAQMVEETVGKPIRHVVLTHLHNDHAGGAPALAEPGVTFYTSPGDTAATRHMFEQAGGTNGAMIQAVSQGARITDGSRTMTVVQIGPNPHTHEMLVAYLEDPETLFVSDLVPGASLEDLAAQDRTAGQAFFRLWLGRTPFGSARLFTMHGTEAVDLGHLPAP